MKHDIENEKIFYKPKMLAEGDAAEYEENAPTYSQTTYHDVDALYHYFVEDPCTPGDLDPDSVTGEGLPDHSEAIAMLLNEEFDHDWARCMDYCETRTEIGFNQFRDTAAFIGGSITSGVMPRLKREFRRRFDDKTIFLDADKYCDEREIDTVGTPFEQLMDLAGRTKQVIDDGVVSFWPTSAKTVMSFVNASPVDQIHSLNRIYDVNEQVETKWMIEGRFLANELIKIEGFQKNFNKLVIFGAMRYILSGDLNLNKLYRLMAKLGRTNTRLFFVG